ncbi:uncharacterized protein METZ01_LOCUS89666 [marine metagenome]|uniref:Uncharacterized protein n=1 Tax=marine metagenome TaxID=408172 RepID=A0A381V8U8_9ZZZZ
MFLTEHGMGKAYVRAVEIKPKEVVTDVSWTKYENATQRQYHESVDQDPDQTQFQFSLSRTIGIWVAAFFTLFILSFLYRDNPFYKIAESVVVGVSAAYWMVVGFWTTIVPNLLGKLAPEWINSWAMPGLDTEAEYIYLVPLIMGIMLIWRLAPKGGWISRWPLAFIIGTTAGIRLIGFIHADFLGQIRNTIMSLAVYSPETGLNFWDSIKNIIIVIGVLTTIVYFFFSIEHEGLVGQTAKVGIWFLMITFGAAFGYTVMGRIALLAIRMEFLMNDWLWLIDPSHTRVLM